MSCEVINFERADDRPIIGVVAAGGFQIPLQVGLEAAEAAGGTNVLARLLVNGINFGFDVGVSIGRNPQGGYLGTVVGATDAVVGITIGAVVSSIVEGGLLAAGFTAGAPLTVAVGLATAAFVYYNNDDIESIANTVGDIVGSIAGGSLDNLEDCLDWLDDIYGYPGDPTPISDWITDAAALFRRRFVSPIVLDLNGNGLDLTNAANGVHFDIDADGFAERTGWVRSTDGLLVRDLNRNGVIDSQRELFGTDAASTAAQKLAALDVDNDGVARGAELSGLRVWRDLNQDGVSQIAELFTLESQGINSLSVAIVDTNSRVQGNVLDWRSTWFRSDGTVGGSFWDVLFETRQEDSRWVDEDTTRAATVDFETLLLPLSRGYGVTKALHIAASEDPAVLRALQALEGLSLEQLSAANRRVYDVLVSWTGVTDVAPNSGGPVFNQQYIALMERLFDHDFRVNDGIGRGSEFPVVEANVTPLSDAFALTWQNLKTRLLVQGPLQPVFENAYYSFADDNIKFNDTLTAVLDRAKALEPASETSFYWQEIGLVLVVHAAQFGGNVAAIRTALDAAAGTHVAIFEGWFVGHAGSENTTGSRFADHAELGGGDDRFWGDGGSDWIVGGAGKDVLIGGDGDDTLAGGRNRDVLLGGPGNDRYFFARGDGNDLIRDDSNQGRGGGTDQLVIEGYRPRDLAFSRRGNSADLSITFSRSATDTILVEDGLSAGSSRVETITVGRTTWSASSLAVELLARQTTPGNDTVVGYFDRDNLMLGGAGDDRLTGGNLNDTLQGGVGSDEVRGGNGNDTYRYAAGDGDDRIWDNGRGDDRLVIEGYSVDSVGFERVGNTDDLRITFGGSSTDGILVRKGLEEGGNGIEAVHIGTEIRSLASFRAEVLAQQTTGGDDYIVGFRGIGQTIFGGAGDDRLVGSTEKDILLGGRGDDVLEGGSGDDELAGGVGNDRLVGGNGSDSLAGQQGDDTLIGGNGVDVLTGGAGADIFSFVRGDVGTGSSADQITDFNRVQGDKILLSGFGLSADDFVGTSSFIGGRQPSFGAGTVQEDAGIYTVVRIDRNGDSRVDAEIRLSVVDFELVADDFLFS